MYAQAEYVPTDVVVEQGGEMFRRTRVPRTRAASTISAAVSPVEALEMLDAALALYPTPAPEHCAACHFRAPCLAMNEGADAEAILTETYRVRPPEAPGEGRLGAVTWSMSRGAAPPPQWRNRSSRP